MYSVVMVPKQRFRPVLVLTVGTISEANELRGVLIDFGYLEFSSLKVVGGNETVDVDTYWFWPWRKVVTAHLALEDND